MSHLQGACVDPLDRITIVVTVASIKLREISVHVPYWYDIPV